MVQHAFLKEAIAGRPALSLLFALYVAYMIAAAFGQWLVTTPDIPIIVWPPNGVTLAALLANQRRAWPWLLAVAAIGELTGNAVWFHNPILPAFGYVAANVLEVVAAAFALTWFFTLPVVRFATLGQVLAFLAIGVMAAPVIGATIGSGIDHAVGKNPFQTTWPFWWLGDATGILIAAPLVISSINAIRDPRPLAKLQIAEAAAIGLLLIALGTWVFSGGRPFAFILFLPILWAALRFEMQGAALATLIMVLVIGFHSQDSAQSAFAGGTFGGSARAQLFMISAASTGLIVAAIIRQFRQATTDLAVANSLLEQRVIERTTETEAAERRFRATFENAAVGMSIVDSAGTLASVNDSLASMLGYEKHELEGLPLDRFTHPDDLPANESAWQKLRRGIADSYELDKRYLRKDGEVVWGHTSVSCVRNAEGEIAYLIKVIQDITARKQSDDARQILLREVNHRSKNLLSVIQAIARQTAAASPPEEFRSRFAQRLQALSANQDLLIASEWAPVTLEDLVRAQLAHLGDDLDERFSISGSLVLLSSPAAQALGMAVHELATNAMKYGSLSNLTGRVEIAWRTTDDLFEISWKERNGPRVARPEKTGFGSTVIDAMIKSALQGNVTIEYAPEGLTWRLTAPISSLSE